MKIAIPTNNGLTIESGINRAKGFLILELLLGEIISEEIRWITQTESTLPDHDIFPIIADCNSIIVSNINPETEEQAQEKGVKVFVVKEKIITKIILDYLEEVIGEEVNHCCCP